MDVGQGSSIEEIKDLQTNTSWIPATPGKPGFAALPPISKYRQENQPAQIDWLELQMKKTEAAVAHAAGATAEAQNAAAYNGSTSSVTVDRCFTTCEAAAGTISELSGGGINMSNNFSSDNVDMWTNVSFGDLLAMAHASGTMPAAENAKDDTAYSARSYFKPLLSSQSADGNSTFPSSPFNSNSPLRMTDANVPFQLEPVTPDLIKSKGQASNASNLDINVTTLPRGVQSNEDTIKRAEANELQQSREQSELVFNQSELQENHKFDMEGKQDSELNNTTPEKKPKRRKHRPKVVVEGKPKRSPKPRTEKQAGSVETKTEKRKYVRRNKVRSPAPTSAEEVNNTIDEGKTPSSKETPPAKRKYVRRNQVKKSTEKPSEEGSSGTTDPKKVSSPRKSCKRTLNFEFERQASDEHSSYRPSTLDLHANQTESTAQCVQSAQLEQGTEAPNEKTVVGTTYNINCSLNQELRNYLSQHEVQYLSSPSLDKVCWNHDEVMVGNQNESTRGNYRINFSDLTRDKHASILQMTPQSPNCSICSSSTCLPHGKGLKRQRSYRTDEAQFYRLNARGVYFNSMQAYQDILPANKPEVYSSLGMHHPAIYKKKRTEEGHSSPASYIKHFTSEINHVPSSQCNISGTPSNNSSTNIAYNRLQNSNFVPAVVEAEKLRKRRSKGATQVHELASVHEIYKQFQTSTSKYTRKCRLGERYTTSHLSNACMEAPIADTRAPMKTKKQSKKSTFVSSTASNMYIHQQVQGVPRQL